MFIGSVKHRFVSGYGVVHIGDKDMDIKKILIWIPAIIMAMLIFGFSKQDGEESTGLSYKAADIILTVCDKAGIVDYNDNNRDSMIESVQFPIRKAAHMTEYCLLAIAISFPLYVYGVRGIWLILLAGAICVGFAGFDEYHQSFVADRRPSVRDVGIDSIGVTAGIRVGAGILLVYLTYSQQKKVSKKTPKHAETQITVLRSA